MISNVLNNPGTGAAVDGPLTSTDNAIARFDGTTGKIVQDSGVFIDDSDNVSINIAAGDGTLHVHTASAGAVTANSGVDDLIVENNTGGGITILTPDAVTSSLFFGSPSNSGGGVVQWTRNTDLMRVGSNDTGGTLQLMTNTADAALDIDSNQNSLFKPINGATLNIRSATTQLTAMSGASVTATNLIPAGAFIYGVVLRVTTEITGASAFTVGDGTDVDRWGTGIALTAGTTTDVTDFVAAGFGQFSAANDVVLTATTANFTAGAVRLVVHYIDLTPPTS